MKLAASMLTCQREALRIPRLREENEELRSKGAAVAENWVGKGCSRHITNDQRSSC